MADDDLDQKLDLLEKRAAKLDLETLARLSDPKRMLHNALTIHNLDPGGHLLGLNIDYSGAQARIRIPPKGSQTVQNFSFLTMWFLEIHLDPPVRLTNQANNACFYEVNKLLPGGQSIQQQFINPHTGAAASYGLDVGERLIVVPVSMTRYYLHYANHIEWAPPQEDRLMKEDA